MTTPTRDRDRGLGRGVHTLIPADETTATSTPAERARAALAAVQSVRVPVVVLEAVAGLLEELGRTTDDGETRAAVDETLSYLHNITG
ncbi:hypothetical protein [Streptomyces syringium]|uniref:hypothetical protein n=1 Tax=Streptomyces syringium TaxID=76729 RepID=UPI0037D0F85E